MKKKVYYLVWIIVFLIADFSFGAIPAAERAALISLYTNTNGDVWTKSTGWKTAPLDTDGFSMPGTEGGWFGVTVIKNHVTALQIDFNNLIGSIPSQLGDLPRLIILTLRQNQLNGIIPAQLGNLTLLEEIHLNNNQLSGTIPTQLANLSHLKTLYLDMNQLTGSIPVPLANLPNLEQLSLSSNQLTGSIPAQLGNLRLLEILDLNSNQLSGSIPSQLGNLSYLCDLSLYGNQLSGSIPYQLGNLNVLHRLFLHQNRLSGTIPYQLGKLSNLTNLELRENQLTGSIPSQLCNLKKLEAFVFSFNQLTGSIPMELGNMTNLRAIHLYSNKLSGNIPVQLGNLINVYYLNLNGNLLSGEIPSTLVNLTKITDLDIGNNCLFAKASALKTWLTTHDSDWETYQNQCAIPTITTRSISAITSKSAFSGGSVSSRSTLPVIGRGVCWSTSFNPTIGHSKTTDGLGNGSFTSTITGLTPNTLYHVRAYATNYNGTAYGSNISFTTTAQGFPKIALNRAALSFGVSVTGSVTGPQTVLLGNTGGETLNWSATSDMPWLLVTPDSGTNSAALTVSINPTGLVKGNYTGTIQITAPDASNSPQIITVSLAVHAQSDAAGPFGEFATPLDGTTLNNSIPVTGWALDDIEVANVKIYNGDTYVGDAVFVEGARPDLEVAYPTFPNNYKAGWGYMLLTRFLPAGGNGNYTLIAKATDMEGNEVILGSKTITINNAQVAKPFGAIDTPAQGGTASGQEFVNYGWVVTPQPNAIPVDGSTIEVVIDGVIQGHAGYNTLRSDIAALFPGYANTNGAGGYYYINTTNLTNGLHTISWNVTDSGGNSDGIGSRYFSVMNTGTSSDSASFAGTYATPNEESFVPEQRWVSASEADECPVKPIRIKELERVVIHLGDENLGNTTTHSFKGYLMVGQQLRELPIGSTLDSSRGIFYWQPGPGFVGLYDFVFIGTDDQGQSTKKSIVIHINPKQ